jgi:hypothetical protein
LKYLLLVELTSKKTDAISRLICLRIIIKYLLISFIDHFLNQLNDRFLSHRSVIENVNIIFHHPIVYNMKKKIRRLVEM